MLSHAMSSSDHHSSEFAHDYSMPIEEIHQKVGAALRAARVQAGLTIPALVRMASMGFSEEAAKRYEQGKRNIPLKAIVAYARVCKVDTRWFLDGVR